MLYQRGTGVSTATGLRRHIESLGFRGEQGSREKLHARDALPITGRSGEALYQRPAGL
jgi:hypothetical protein